ncbi:MAG TPA: ribonuclease P protein component 4 [Candidatus Nanoarchaeia archaeon]|nr:ribonuclease P protein component 4 [Candidatus Nanoarchaeia archaeon]
MKKKVPSAVERIHALLDQANLNPERSKRYVAIAKRVGLRNRVRMPKEWRRRICKSCDVLLLPGKNCRVRLHEGKVVYRCLECGGVMRYPYQVKK